MATMDLTRLPVTMDKMRKSEKENMIEDRERWWNKFYTKVCQSSQEFCSLNMIDISSMRS